MAVAAAAPAAAGIYPIDVTYAQGDNRRSRVTTFFRYLLAIPNLIVVALWGYAVLLTTFLAWWAILFTGKYPDGLYSFGVSYMRVATDSLAYMHLLTDEYPPWTGNDAKATTYPVQFSAVRPDQSNRVTVFFRPILAIPVLIFAMLIGIATGISVCLAWFAIMFTGRFPTGLLSFTQGAIRSYSRIIGYYYLLSDAYPPFSLS